jgi:hypothetical protein
MQEAELVDTRSASTGEPGKPAGAGRFDWGGLLTTVVGSGADILKAKFQNDANRSTVAHTMQQQAQNSNIAQQVATQQTDNTKQILLVGGAVVAGILLVALLARKA